jgi:hypothetical protein
MQAYYGQRFISMWKTGQVLPDGQDAGFANAMNVWSERLAGFKDSPETIKRVLECLPLDPPTLPQFLELCRHAYVAPKHLMLDRTMTEEEYEQGRQQISKILDDLKQKMSMNSKPKKEQQDGSENV